jgi:vancomycin permeability regulator SanA
MPVTASSLIHTFTIVARDFIHNATQRFHLNREVFTITNQECKSAPVSLTAVSLSGQICNRTRDGMKIPSTSDNLVRSKLSAQLMFSQDDEVERQKDGEVLHRAKDM